MPSCPLAPPYPKKPCTCTVKTFCQKLLHVGNLILPSRSVVSVYMHDPYWTRKVVLFIEASVMMCTILCCVGTSQCWVGETTSNGVILRAVEENMYWHTTDGSWMPTPSLTLLTRAVRYTVSSSACGDIHVHVCLMSTLYTVCKLTINAYVVYDW